MNRVLRKTMAFFLAFIFVFMGFISFSTNSHADEINDYLIDGKEIYLNGDMVVYSETNKINADSIIEYTIDDGEKLSFNAVEVDNSDDYYFIIDAVKEGEWKVSAIDGVEIEDDTLNFKVYNSQEEMEADYNVGKSSVMSVSGDDNTNSSAVVNRYSGANRYSTAVLISKDNYSSSESVIITSGVDYPDALSSVSLSKQINAPILFVSKTSLPNETKTEIKRLGAKKIFIIGGDAAVSNNVYNELKSITGNVERIAGASRTHTAVSVAKKLKNILKM